MSYCYGRNVSSWRNLRPLYITHPTRRARYIQGTDISPQNVEFMKVFNIFVDISYVQNVFTLALYRTMFAYARTNTVYYLKKSTNQTNAVFTMRSGWIENANFGGALIHFRKYNFRYIKHFNNFKIILSINIIIIKFLPSRIL